MIVISRSPRAALISGLIAIAIAAFIYFVLVKPSTDSANKQVNQSLSIATQQEKAAQSQLNSAAGQSATPPAAAAAESAAAKRLACVQAAGTDAAKLAACH